MWQNPKSNQKSYNKLMYKNTSQKNTYTFIYNYYIQNYLATSFKDNKKTHKQGL